MIRNWRRGQLWKIAIRVFRCLHAVKDKILRDWINESQGRAEKVSLLLSCGLYQTLKDLVAPELPKSVEFEVPKENSIKHYGLVRNTRMERAKFRAIMRKEGESVAQYEVRLRNAVRTVSSLELF